MALYNNGYPASYQQYYPTQFNGYPTQMNVAPTQPTQQQINSNLIWVQGEAGAKSYMVAPNTTVQLWDSEAQVIYLKSADASGMPSIKTLDYTIRELPSQTHENAPQSNFATQDDIIYLKEQIAQIRKEMKHGKSSVSNAKQPTDK